MYHYFFATLRLSVKFILHLKIFLAETQRRRDEEMQRRKNLETAGLIFFENKETLYKNISKSFRISTTFMPKDISLNQ
jgi:hypothetical protein